MLTLENCTISANAAVSDGSNSTGIGGGIYSLAAPDNGASAPFGARDCPG